MLKPALSGERVLCTTTGSRRTPTATFLPGRSDDIIKCRGEKVSPIEVENCLHGMPGVREAAVIGVPDELLGEAVVAYVAVEKDSGLTEKEIKGYCVARLENFMCRGTSSSCRSFQDVHRQDPEEGSAGREGIVVSSGELFAGLLAEVGGFFAPCRQADETAETVLRALWQLAAGTPVSVTAPRRCPAGPRPGPDREAPRADREETEGVPLAHLTGRQEFLGLELLSSPAP